MFRTQAAPAVHIRSNQGLKRICAQCISRSSDEMTLETPDGVVTSPSVTFSYTMVAHVCPSRCR